MFSIVHLQRSAFLSSISTASPNHLFFSSSSSALHHFSHQPQRHHTLYNPSLVFPHPHRPISPPHHHHIHAISQQSQPPASPEPSLTPPPLLQVKSLRYVLDTTTDMSVPLFSDLDLDIARNQLVLILGPNGSGKSTLLSLITGLDTALSPTAFFWNGHSVHRRKVADRIAPLVAVVMQDPRNYFIGQTVLDELIHARSHYITPNMVRDVMRKVDLWNVSLLHNLRKLSGGQQRKLMLGSQLLKNPSPVMMVLDEPFVGLDKQARARFVHLLDDFKNTGFGSVVVVSHQPHELLHIADHVLELVDGKLEEIPHTVIDKARRIQRTRAHKG